MCNTRKIWYQKEKKKERKKEKVKKTNPKTKKKQKENWIGVANQMMLQKTNKFYEWCKSNKSLSDKEILSYKTIYFLNN